MISKGLLLFLKEIEKHNNRDWFNLHKEEYLREKEQFEQFIAEILGGMAQIDVQYELLKPKDCVFRIYRDVRFSKNKAPYKTHFAAGISKTGKRVHFPGYHLHITPNDSSFFAGGIWHPGKEQLSAIRQEIDYNLEEFTGILRKIERSGLFEPMSDEDTLVRPPKGYAPDNPAIQYLKMRNFTLGTVPITDKAVTQNGLIDNLLKSAAILKPFLDFLERALD